MSETIGPDTPQNVVPGTAEYEEHVRAELTVYSGLFETETARERLMEPTCASWTEVHLRAAQLTRDATGADMTEHVVRRLSGGGRLLSLGSGPGGVEITFAQQAPEASFHCIDLNEELLDLGRQRAEELALAMTFEAADLNVVSLPCDAFDIVFCHASLHHILRLEHVVDEIRKTLRRGGVLITVDVVAMNGYRMWDETRPIAQALFRSLPAKFRVNHTGYSEPTLDEELWEPEESIAVNMECIRSEDILPVLRERMVERAFVPYYSLTRRFLDPMYGPSYDLDAPLDRALFEWIWELDLYYLRNEILKPETFFGIYSVD